MLRLFLSRKGTPEVRRVCEKLSILKGRIMADDFNDPLREYRYVEPCFEAIKCKALTSGDEELANAQAVFNRYFLLFCNLAKYHSFLLEGNYRQSWNKLQDCLDCARFVGRFTPIDRRLDVPDIVGLLDDYEHLYPYTHFLSPEFVIKESHCSICGESMQSLSCPHRKGQLYRGKVAKEVVDKMRLQAISVVENPENKRCVIEYVDGKTLSFSILKEFLKLELPCLQRFTIIGKIMHGANSEAEEYTEDGPSAHGSSFADEICHNTDVSNYLRCAVIPGKRIQLVLF